MPRWRNRTAHGGALDRNEVLAYTAMIAGAGNETTARLIGFMGQLLGEHPDQRHELVADPR